MSTMLDPETPPNPAKEIVHKGKGCLAVIIALAVLVGGGYFVWDRAANFLSTIGEVPDYEGAGKDPITISIPAGSSLDDIGGILVDAGVVKSTKAWKRAAGLEERATSIQAGRYVMKTQLPATAALTLLLNPGESRVRVQFTVPEGLRLSAQVEELVKGTKISKKNFDQALKTPKNLGLPSFAKNKPEGFLFPETYELTESATATDVLKQMTTEFGVVAGDIDLEARAKALGIDPYEAVVVASIIEREVRNPDDRAKVARVIYNRLDKGQKLEMDSTVHYAVNKDTSVTTTDADRANSSPYNTYVHKGLPPGPISAPGKAALEAAVNPAEGNWLYFVTVNPDTGETKFTDDYAEHEQNVQQFQQWCSSNAGRC